MPLTTNDPADVLGPDLVAEMATVADHDRFATVDELHAAMARLADAHPGVASLRRIGTSRLGEPIHALTVGEGPRHAVVFAMPHPNEPIGGLTATHLASRLCADADLRDGLGYTWHIVDCIDPDGTRLNEGWFAGPFTRTHYGRHFYRPAGPEQVEWSFPFAYKDAWVDTVMPETLALMRLIDDTQPTLMVSLHNSELGGAYYYVTRPDPELHPVLQAVPQHAGIPLDRGEPEASFMQAHDDGIFAMMEREDAYDHAVEIGQDPLADPSGATSSSWADRHGTYTLICELPYWLEDTSGDTADGRSYADLLREQAEAVRETMDLLLEVMHAVEPDLVARDSPFMRASRYFLPAIATVPDANEHRAAQEESQRPATPDEVRSMRELVHSYRVRYGGILRRALDGELAIGNATPTIRTQADRLATVHDQWCDEAEAATPTEPIAIRRLVAAQYGAILATARHLARP